MRRRSHESSASVLVDVGAWLMAWALLDDNFPNHPKAVEAGPLAAYLFVCGLCYCRRFHTDGFIPRKALPMLGVSGNPRRMVDRLIDVGMWHLDGDGWRINGYEEFYADAIDKARKESRREGGRKGGIESRKLNTLTSKLRGDGTGTSDQEKIESVDPAFAEFWDQYPRKDGKQAAIEVWRRLRPDAVLCERIAVDVAARARSPQWVKDNGQFIPHARTYLNQRRWDDGFVPSARGSDHGVPGRAAWRDECQHVPKCKMYSHHELLIEKAQKAS